MASGNDRDNIEAIVKEYGRLLKEALNVKHVYLYGSYAKGTYSPDSDIDVAVVGDDFSGDPVEDTSMLMRLRRKVDTREEAFSNSVALYFGEMYELNRRHLQALHNANILPRLAPK